MTPYRELVATPIEAHYNRRQSRARCVVEWAFGMLNAHWRSISFLKLWRWIPTFFPLLCFASDDIIEAKDVITNDDDDDDDVANHEENAEP